MTLVTGTRLGPYEILAPIGAGGMGEVYRARDERLKRDVAIKVIHAALSGSPDRLARFEQEAHAAAALNHPNILAVYDIGTSDPSTNSGQPYVVAELLEGTTLREALVDGPLPISKAVDVARQVAAGLAAAHAKGITHRDIKPENLFLTRDGRAKVLDFGLAKLREDSGGASQATRLQASTEPGAVLGTVGYMSPEQVRGQTADARSDIFSLGVVLFEMLSGVRPFHRDSAVETMNAILKEDPAEPSAGNSRLPASLERIVGHCLEKNPDQRYQSAQDLAFALQSAASGGGSGSVQAIAGSGDGRVAQGWNRPAGWALAALLFVATVGLASWVLLRHPEAAPGNPVVRVEVPVPADAAILVVPRVTSTPVALSPDGRFLAFVAFSGGTSSLWVRPLDSLTARRIAGTEAASGPFWSPDSRSIAFSAGGKLKRVNVAGGEPQVLCETTALGGGSWNTDGVLLFSPAYGGESALVRLPASGGTPIPVTQLDPAHGETNHAWPQFLPDGHHFVFNVAGRDNSGLYVGSLDSRERTLLLPFNADPRDVGISAIAYAAPGYLLYVYANSLMAYPLDLDRLKFTGPPVSVAEGIEKAGPGVAAFSSSNTGVLAYWTGSGVPMSQVTWLARDGTAQAHVGAPGGFTAVALAPDEQQIAVSRVEAGRQSAIWVLGVARETATRVTFDAVSLSPVWSRDGSSLAYGSVRDGPPSVFRKAANGAGQDVRLFKADRSAVPTDWCGGDGAVLFETRDATTQFDIWRVPPAAADQQAVAVVRTPFNESGARCSPDAHWIAYTSDESGRPEVYVTSFPGAEGKFPISTGGGTQPRWRGDGTELFYVAPDGMLMSVRVRMGATFDAGATTPLFRLRGTSYDVTRNGERFVTNDPAGSDKSQPMTVVLNWTSEMKK